MVDSFEFFVRVGSGGKNTLLPPPSSRLFVGYDD